MIHSQPNNEESVRPESPRQIQTLAMNLNKIVNSDYNPRKDFREETLQELSESIRQSGVLQPICVRPKDEGFEIVYGERRYWAAAMAGLSRNGTSRPRSWVSSSAACQ